MPWRCFLGTGLGVPFFISNESVSASEADSSSHEVLVCLSQAYVAVRLSGDLINSALMLTRSELCEINEHQIGEGGVSRVYGFGANR